MIWDRLMISSRKIREYKDKYGNKEIKTSTEINNFLNLSNAVEMRTDIYSVFGIVYSISMDDIKIFFKEDIIFLALPKNKNLGSMQLKKNLNSNNN